jgi:hypothetical protein
MKIPQPPATWSPVWRCILLLPVSAAFLVLFTAAALGTGVEQAFLLTLGQVGHMAVHYPLWAWLVIVVLLAVGTRFWGLVGAVLMYYPISSIVYRLDVGIIAATGADTGDLIFALGCFHRMAILVVAFFWLVVLPTIIWRRRKLNLSVSQGCFCFRLKYRYGLAAR